MRRKKELYPGVKEAEAERIATQKRNIYCDNSPDFIGNAPNYEKFKGWDTEKVLVWLNID